ncbi:MAG: hypothetical protein ACRER2_10195 [Methylococcales bacterium]
MAGDPAAHHLPGTRSEQGSRSLGLIASVIETCRLRTASPYYTSAT